MYPASPTLTLREKSMDKVMSLSVNIVKIGLDLILKNFTTGLEVKNNGGF